MRLSWGFTAKTLTASKTRESYLVPPPTTLIGALAYGYSRLHRMPELHPRQVGSSSAEEVRRLVVSVNESVKSPLFQYADLSKIRWYYIREKEARFDAVALGKVYKGFSRGVGDLDVVYVVREESHMKTIAVSAHSIVRVGGSHGLVSVENVEYGPLQCSPSETDTKTRYSFWEDLAVNVSPQDVLVQEVVDYRKASIGSYAGAPLRRRIYPYSLALLAPIEVNVKVDSRKAVICRAGEEVVIVER